LRQVQRFPWKAGEIRPKAHVPREGFETELRDSGWNFKLKGRRHTFPERGLRPLDEVDRLADMFRPKAHVPREGFETAPPPFRSYCQRLPKAHVPREGFETRRNDGALGQVVRPKAHVPREGFET